MVVDFCWAAETDEVLFEDVVECAWAPAGMLLHVVVVLVSRLLLVLLEQKLTGAVIFISDDDLYFDDVWTFVLWMSWLQNSRIRNLRFVSTRSVVPTRPWVTNQQITFVKLNTIQAQHQHRSRNHPHRDKCKSPSKSLFHPIHRLKVATWVYLYSNCNKLVLCTKSLPRLICQWSVVQHPFVGSW